MPSVMQASSPRSFTSRTMLASFSTSRSFSSRHAAPMQKRPAPAFLAFSAAARTWARSSSFSASTPVSYFTLCAQYLQSS